MFKKSRRKIVTAIMSILVLLWVGTLGIIYISSYFEMSKQNVQMLKAHSGMYAVSYTHLDVYKRQSLGPEKLISLPFK